MKNKYHETVLSSEIIEALHIEKGSLYIDATLGNGGHALEILKLGGKVLGIEMDPKMIEIATSRLKEFKEDLIIVNANFKDIDRIVKDNNLKAIKGIIFDLGVTNIHLKSIERGFSFDNPDAELDMRLNPDSQGVKASDLLNVLREDQLRQLFGVTLDPGPAKWISGRILFARALSPIKTVGDMLEICKGLRTGKSTLNQATLPFLAIRIAVGSELENLKEALPKAYDALDMGGRLAVISFHSGEDKLVKDFFKEKADEGATLVTFKPILAGEKELSVNRRSRSAKLRILEK